tara:strand:+ start:126 stop:320 length:195 start_codon:yes stop_codon:yes gene_type:complete
MNGMKNFLQEFCELLGDQYSEREFERLTLDEMVERLYMEKEKEKEKMLKKLAEEHGFKEIKIKK